MNQPIKRHETLQPLSRDHHQGLLLCFKIRKGIAGQVAVSRIKNYTDWFYREHLVPHFEVEEKLVFPVLGNDHPLVVQALAEHRRLHQLVATELDSYSGLETFARELDNHIRFEERILFNEIQNSATPEQLKTIEQMHHEATFCEKRDDVFWV